MMECMYARVYATLCVHVMCVCDVCMYAFNVCTCVCNAMHVCMHVCMCACIHACNVCNGMECIVMRCHAHVYCNVCMHVCMYLMYVTFCDAI